MPRLWSETVETHRAAVWTAIVEATVALVAEHGLRSVTMSQIAEAVGITRATLYKYFPDVESILTAWHERQVAEHLAQLEAIRDQAGSPAERLAAVLDAYAQIQHEQHDTELVALLHGGEHVSHAHHQLAALLEELLAESARAGELRRDVPPGELASYCLHALIGAGSLPSSAAVERLVSVTMAALRP